MNRREALAGGFAFAFAGAGQASLPDEGAFARDIAATLMPATVFFAGKLAPVQGRNTGGAKLPGGLLLAGLVDNSGYSSAVQERYQAYLLLSAPVRFGEHALEAGAYGCGVVEGHFVVMNLGAQTLWTLPAPRDGKLPRPTPLQVLAGGPGMFRLYFGRNSVSFAPEPGGAPQ